MSPAKPSFFLFRVMNGERKHMVNMIWMDEASGVCVVTHELFSRPASLIGVVLPLATWPYGDFLAFLALSRVG